MATSDDSGAAWALFPDDIITGGSAYAGALRLAGAPDAALFETWAVTSGVYVHRGTDKSSPNFDYHYTQLPGASCCGYEPDLAVDGTAGTMWLAWASLSAGHPGVWVNQADTATGAPVGSATRMPGSVASAGGTEEFSMMGGFTPITGRRGGAGVFVAYPTGYPTHTGLLVWRIGAAAAMTLDSQTGGNYRQVAIAAEPSGHVWVVWGNDTPGGAPLYARRSNAGVTAWGPKVPITRLPGAASTWAMSADAQDGLLDVLVNYTEANGTTRYYHTQAPPLPPPTLGKTVNATVVSGTVRVRPKGARKFRKLDELAQLPVGTTVDTLEGRVRIQSALPGGGTQAADFYRGMFRVAQPA